MCLQAVEGLSFSRENEHYKEYEEQQAMSECSFVFQILQQHNLLQDHSITSFSSQPDILSL